MKVKGLVKNIGMTLLLAAPLMALSSCSLLKEDDCDCPSFGKNGHTEKAQSIHSRK